MEKVLCELSLEWKQDDNGTMGLYHRNKKGTELVSNFLPCITACYQKSGSESTYVDLAIRISDNKERVIRKGVDMRELKGIVWNRDVNYRCYVARGKEKLLLNLLDFQCSFLERGEIIDSLGWCIYQGARVYSFGTHVMGKTNVMMSDKMVMNYKSTFFPKFSKKDTLAKMTNFLCNGGETVYSVFLAMVHSILRNLFKQAGIGNPLILFIYGPTQTFKTTVARYFVLAGKEEWKVQPQVDLTSTSAAIEKMLFEFKDMLFLLDDLAPLERKSEMKKRNDQISSIIRTVANYTDRKKCIGNHVKSNYAEVDLIVTAEVPLGIESIMNRTLILNTNTFPVSKKTVDQMRDNQDLIKDFCHYFINWLISIEDGIIDAIKKTWKLYGESEIASLEDLRLRETYNIFRITAVIVDTYLSGEGEKLIMHSITNRFEKFMKNIFEENINELRTIRLNNRKDAFSCKVIIAIYELIENGELRIGSKFVEEMNDGFEKNNRIYVVPANLRRRVCEKLNLGREDLTISKLSRILNENQLVSCGNGRDVQVKRKSVKFYEIIRFELEDYIKELEES